MMKVSTKKWQVIAWSGMSYSLQQENQSCIVGQQAYENLWIAYLLICGLKWEPEAQLC